MDLRRGCSAWRLGLIPTRLDKIAGKAPAGTQGRGFAKALNATLPPNVGGARPPWRVKEYITETGGDPRPSPAMVGLVAEIYYRSLSRLKSSSVHPKSEMIPFRVP